jgi:hypothetical protein
MNLGLQPEAASAAFTIFSASPTTPVSRKRLVIDLRNR